MSADGQRAGRPEHGRARPRRPCSRLEDQQQLAAVERSASAPAGQGEDEVRDRIEKADDPERGGGAAEQQDDVAEGAPPRPSCRSARAARRRNSSGSVGGAARRAPAASPACGRAFRAGRAREAAHRAARATPPRDRVCLEASVPQPVRHTDARRLAQSGAGEDDRRVARELAEPAAGSRRVECEPSSEPARRRPRAGARPRGTSRPGGARAPPQARFAATSGERQKGCGTAVSGRTSGAGAYGQ